MTYGLHGCIPEPPIPCIFTPRSAPKSLICKDIRYCSLHPPRPAGPADQSNSAFCSVSFGHWALLRH